MNIAIIGAGNVGRALATSSAAPGTRSPSRRAIPKQLRPSAAEHRRTGRRVQRSTPSAAPISSSSPFPSRAARRSPARSRAAVRGKVVIDVTNPDQAHLRRAQIDAGGPSAAERFAEWLPQAHRGQGLQHRVCVDPGRPDRRWRPARWLRRRRRRRREGAGPRARRLDRTPSDRCRPARPGPRARGAGLAQHQPARYPRQWLADRLEAGRRPERRPRAGWRRRHGRRETEIER